MTLRTLPASLLLFSSLVFASGPDVVINGETLRGIEIDGFTSSTVLDGTFIVLTAVI